MGGRGARRFAAGRRGHRIWPLGQRDDVDWDQQALVLWRSGESGSCPEALVEVATSDDGTVEVATDRDSGPGMDCEGDYNPYRMLLAIDRDRLPNADELPAELDGVARGQARTRS